MEWVSEDEKRRAQHALRYIRALIPDARSKLESAYGADWADKIKEEHKLRRRPSLGDARSFLGLLSQHGDRQPAVKFDLIPHGLARRLLTIANAAHHEDAPWKEGDDHRAHTLARSFVLLSGLEIKRVHAAVPGHHQEIFELRGSKVRHRWWPNEATSDHNWSPWSYMEVATTGVVDIAAVGQKDRLDVFLLTIDGLIEVRTWRMGDGWTVWRPLPVGGERVVGPISAVSFEPGHTEVFATGANSQLVHRWAYNDDWTDWHNLSDDDNLRKSDSPHTPTQPKSLRREDRLEVGEVLYRDQTLTSTNGRFTLTLHNDGHLVLRDGREWLWNSDTPDSGGERLELQGDGNLVLRKSNGESVWHSGTHGKPSVCAVVQDDGNTVIYTNDGVGVWHTDTYLR